MGPPGSRRPLYRGRTLLGPMKSTGERRSKAVGGTHSIYSEILHLVAFLLASTAAFNLHKHG